jgi:hypothetical protein
VSSVWISIDRLLGWHFEEGQISQAVRVDLVYGPLINFVRTLSFEDEVVIEATGNCVAVEGLMRPYVKRITIANSRQVRGLRMHESKSIRSMPQSWLVCRRPALCPRFGCPTRIH